MTTIEKTQFNANLKLIFAIVVATASIVWWFSKSQSNTQDSIKEAQKISRDNNELLKEILKDNKEQDRMTNLKITEIENHITEQRVRLTLIENNLNK